MSIYSLDQRGKPERPGLVIALDFFGASRGNA
jgi:hypothetical protein